MYTPTALVREIAQDYVQEELPDELEYFETIWGEMLSRTPLTDAPISGEQKLGFGLGDVAQFLQTPAVIAVLSSLWTGLLAPVVKDLAVDMGKRHFVKDDLPNEMERRLSRDKIRQYVADRAKKTGLDEIGAKRLAEYVVNWLARHPKDVQHLITKSSAK